jgi:type VI secretion system protein ImpK
MTPKFAAVVEPLIVSLLSMVDQAISRPLIFLRTEATRAIDQAAERLDGCDDWEDAKHALVCWFDYEIISIHPEWKDNPLEVHYFNQGIGGEEFFRRAEKAYRDHHWDALEVYYLCFLMGFRGIYWSDQKAAIPSELPETKEAWQKEIAKRLANKRYRPPSEWAEVRTNLVESEELVGWKTLVDTSLFFCFAAVCLGLALFCWWKTADGILEFFKALGLS